MQKKKMCAMMMMYSGVGYFGMQRNEGFRTIEGDILQAMFDAQVIDEDNFKKPAQIRFQRASKTDKSVSAIGQVCSIKLSDIDNNIADMINSKLPPQIRILDVFRTTKSFHAKALCKYRTYRYITPSFAFSPKETTTDDLIGYRIDSDTLNRVNSVLSNFKGTHNYHNFTSGRTPQDSSCRRYLMDLTCEQPFVDDGGVNEYVAIVINGQSFMLHQIRKMVALTMAVVRGHCDETVFQRVFQLGKVDLPRAPGLGLVLDRVNYDTYNEKYALDGERKPIDWNVYQTEIDEFREKFVYSHIYQQENEEKSMVSWLETLGLHSYMFRESVNGDSGDSRVEKL